MSRYFKIKPEPYERIRATLDSAMSLTPPETVYQPLASAPQSTDGDALLAVREQHCDIELFATAIADMLAAGEGAELTRAQYDATRPRPVVVTPPPNA